jgi:hypothetical protein
VVCARLWFPIRGCYVGDYGWGSIENWGGIIGCVGDIILGIGFCMRIKLIGFAGVGSRVKLGGSKVVFQC